MVADGTGTELALADGVRSFDWRSDGRLIAAYIPETGGFGGRVRLIDPVDGKELGDFPVHSLGEPQELAWQGNRRLLLLYHLDSSGGELRRYVLEAFDPETGRGELLTASPINTREVMWLPLENGILWHEQDRAGVHRLKHLADPRVEPREINTKGAYHFRAISADGEQVSVAEYAQGVHRLLRLPLKGGNAVVVAEQRGASRQDIVHETRSIASNGAEVPMLVSRLTGKSRLNAVVIRVHAGKALSLAGDRWAEMQLYLQHGVHFMHVENRGAETVHDIQAACVFARRELDVPLERIVVLGGSSGGAMSLEALMRYPNCTGTLVLVGTTAPPGVNAAATALQRVSVLAFHGENDVEIKPAHARAVIEMIFGPEALAAPRGRWHVFRGEGHWLQRDESIATVHTLVLSHLRAIKSTIVPVSEQR